MIEAKDYLVREASEIDDCLFRVRRGDTIIAPTIFDYMEDFRKKMKKKALELESSIHIDTKPITAPLKNGYISYRFH